MKQLPEAARVIVERARDAHDPSEAQLQNMLANLHTQLGYSAAPNEPAGVPEAATAAVSRARGLLHAKLLKLVLSLAAMGGIAALVAPRIWNAEVTQPPAAVVVAPVPEEPRTQPVAEVVPVREPVVEVAAQIAPQAPRARSVQEKGERRAVVSRKPSPESTVANPASASTQNDVVIAPQVEQVNTAVAVAPKVAAEKVLLSEDVVPLQSARKRAEDKASGPSDADELRLISRAASLLRDGEPEEALELLQEHGRKFPASQLKVERRGLSVLARCGAGQVEQGRRERAEFLRDAAGAPIAARVRKACPERQP
jgi:hypothetical protein